jgi:hypothetical protein
MPDPNSMNTEKGRDFQKSAALILKKYYKVGFQTEYPVAIGNPPKEHKFDLVSDDHMYVGECKNFSWTETGNVPSAKIGFINQAVFYLQHLSNDKKRFVVLRRDIHQKHAESLGEYYYRLNNHLLNGVFLIEIDMITFKIQELGLK